MKKIISIFLGLFLGLLSPCHAQKSEGVTPIIFKGHITKAYEYADSVMHTLSNRDKLAQLIMPMVYPKNNASSLKAWDDMVTKWKFGGVLWQKGDPAIQLELTNRMRTRAPIPMMIAMDGEWGLSMRLSHTLRYPRNMLLGAVNDPKLIHDYGRAVAMEAKRMGIHVNFAPDIDVNNNQDNPVIGTRSFGSDPARVVSLGSAYADGLEQGGVLSCAKHFPGHGNTNIDSHKSLPTIEGSRESLEKTELYPFKYYILRGFGGVMVGHLKVPALGTGDQPATLSKEVVTNLLVSEMGFKGLIFTDALAMEGAKSSSGKPIALAAFEAGNDILLASKDPISDLRILEEALNNGTISIQEVEKRCQKVLAFKYALGVYDKQAIPTANLYADLNPSQHRSLIDKLNEGGMTLLKNHTDLIPIRELGNKKIALLRYGSYRAPILYSSLKSYTSIDSYALSSSTGQSERRKIYDQLSQYDLVIVAVTSQRERPDSGLVSLVKKVPTILTFMTTPYTALSFNQVIPNTPVVAIGYENTSGAQKAMGAALFGGIPFKGILPVDLSPLYKVGSGIKTLKTRLSYADPNRVGVSASRLAEIDEIAHEGIDKGAYPGCQILVAKDGYIIYEKAFGSKDARGKDSTTIETIYDLASVTKAIATTSLIMKAYDSKELQISDPIGKHLPYLRGSDKSNIRISDLLFHTGGMPAVIPFYLSLIDRKSYTSPLLSYRKRAGFPTQIASNAYARRGFKYRTDLVSRDSSELYPTRFVKGMYLSKNLRDTMRMAIRDANLHRKGYRYSDIDFLLLQDILEEIYQKPEDRLFEEHFAQPLGASRLLYKPYQRFSNDEIAEGQKDNFLRHTTLRGDVDDEAAAMLGGVSGNAGLYGTARDIAKLLQMLLNGGYYGGERYLNENTIKLFRSAKHSVSPYSLGYDRPRHRGNVSNVSSNAPSSIFGHTGFTGTCFWVDPDNQLIYIFLSNRGAPIRWNPKLLRLDIRPRIQEVIYQSLK